MSDMAVFFSNANAGGLRPELLLAILLLAILLEKALKHLLVLRFFARPAPPPARPLRLVSILQPILSGDPALAEGLQHNLAQTCRYPREWIWLVDQDDTEGQRICADLIRRYPEQAVLLILLAPPGERQNPKMVKLIAGARAASGDVICVLDDDTRLPAGGLETCLPYLDQPGAGLAFGLPYYVSFANLWSRLVAYFVNSHSLLTYVPYAVLSKPVTINGMFYALRRATLERIGGFEGLEHILADDFAIAQRVRQHGLRLVQTPLRHAISTTVAGPRGYGNLIRRWFTFPRESMMRHLKGREKAVFYLLTILPAFYPWLALAALAFAPGLWPLTALYLAYHSLIFAQFNARFLGLASPWAHSYWVALIPLLLPLQILAALLAPQRIIWRGHTLQAEPGGGFRFVRRR